MIKEQLSSQILPSLQCQRRRWRRWGRKILRYRSVCFFCEEVRNLPSERNPINISIISEIPSLLRRASETCHTSNTTEQKNKRLRKKRWTSRLFVSSCLNLALLPCSDELPLRFLCCGFPAVNMIYDAVRYPPSFRTFFFGATRDWE